MTIESNPLDLLTDLIGKAGKAGADGADAVFVESGSLALSQRLGEPERLERSEHTDLGLRVFVGRRQAIVSSSDLSPGALQELVERALAMARSTPEDPYCGLAEPELLAAAIADLDICDESEPATEVLAERAARAEDAARAVAGVTNSEGAEASWGRGTFAIAASNGFAQTFSSSRHSIGVAVLAGEGTAMERDFDYASAVYAEDLSSPEEIGLSAGEKAVARLNPRKADSSEVPVIYDWRISNGIVSHLASAINGSSVARGTTFLKDRLEKRIFPDSVIVVDDPLRRRGLKSKPFDVEGVATGRRNIIDSGVLTTWILDLRSARQLKTTTTGHASRGTSSPPSPSPTNLYLQAGALSPKELMSDIKNGFYITELIGFGINAVTGDYSRGACGFWIENGEPAYPVSEVTVAGNLNDMFAHLTAADDLRFRFGTNAPTLRIDGMTVAGK